MLHLIFLGACGAELVSVSCIWGQLTTVRAMARYYGTPEPTVCDAIGLLRAARRGDQDAKP
ncbi:hypothetical protein [Catenulispora rubra]|uniref:hypothetical protein n=1 Tax=Catenulispora rubra TaxID=280293 RepID=UPI0018920FB7|nr:hypothetical protein [Catenulispora rubra]